MNEKEAKIQSLVGKLVENRDLPSLDVLFTLAYSLPSMSGYHKNLSFFQKWVGRLGSHNLQIKHNLKVKEAKEKLKILREVFDDIPDFLSGSNYDPDRHLFHGVLINNSK